MMGKARFLALASALALGLSACSYDPVDEEAAATGEGAEMSSETLSALIASGDGLDTVKDLMNDAGLADAFDGNAPYTVFAPTDEAMAALGPDFEGEEARPALLAVLRDHIVPGYMTIEDITAALERGDGSVEMQTMGERTLTFTQDGDAVTVKQTDGDQVATLGQSMQGTNGVVYPVDTVLTDFDPEG
ncbi:fasciclin domain-containing protein [Aurantiacibacter luteus]|uniref:fasciclin domain-containing protein n=1 Tax=Aurantiacibacter luteus TaxID=1581420 RepID=UPI00069C348D|nr:fasciclin domain-containing protein [Aurantiacibacter luteus]